MRLLEGGIICVIREKGIYAFSLDVMLSCSKKEKKEIQSVLAPCPKTEKNVFGSAADTISILKYIVNFWSLIVDILQPTTAKILYVHYDGSYI
uniref:Uncharacterized protein n=1 Tax=Oryza brachyantha TaxID=4533 RepID=J3NCG3_ORYBR